LSNHSLRTTIQTRDWQLSVLLSLTWGSSFLLIAISIEHFDPAVISFGRSLTGALALWFFRGARQPIKLIHWPRIALLGLIWMAIPFWLFPLAEQTVASSVAGMINGSLPVVMALVTAMWVRRVPSGRRVVTVLFGFVGILVIALPTIRAESAGGASVADTHGILYLLAAVTCYAMGANIARPLQAQFSPARLLMRVQFAATLWTLPFASAQLDQSEFAMSAIGAVVVLGIVGTGIAFVAFGTLVERTGIARAMIPTYFTPIVGLVLGAVFRNERIAIVSVIGMCIVIGSAWLTSKPDERDVLLGNVD